MAKTAHSDAKTWAEHPTRSILSLVKQVQYKAYVRLESVFQPLGVTAVQFRILTTLSSRPGLSSAELARLYDVKPQTMIKQIALLEAKGLIGRRTSPTNRRLLELTLTEEGQACLKLCRTGAQAMERTLLEPLDETEQAHLRAMLVTLLQSMSGPVVAEGDDPDIEEFSRVGVQRV
ncbi:MarR family winged helix-turn-helix transcriptional regulator [Sphingobium nicotianae]|nr:MarR family transcriptional regulator [Sphingobium nicotianae]